MIQALKQQSGGNMHIATTYSKTINLQINSFNF
jgi:hypothetical protein